jgi:delta8-fatty-acid desaturase
VSIFPLHTIESIGANSRHRLHSEEARRRMKSFIIGRVKGQWDNFLPPIQGGTFLPYDGEEDDERQTAEVTESVPLSEAQSSGSSLSSSESGDEPFLLDPRLRRRRAASLSSSVTSISEVVGPTGSSKFDAEYLTRKAIEEDLIKYPSLDYGTQREIIRKYRELESRIRAEGLYECNYWAYGRECIRYALLFFGSLMCLKYGWYKTSAFLLGSFWHQLVFSAHDAGHMGITHNFQVDTCIGIFIANFLGGLSLGWWKRSHNVRAHLTSCL